MTKRAKTGGRAPGTPNRVTSVARSAITSVLDDYYGSSLFKEDLAELEPKDRVAAMEKLAAYAVPKLQTTTLDVINDKKKTIEDTLAELAGEE